MARFTRIQVATTMLETGIVPLMYHPDVSVCINVLKACYDGGIRIFEFTSRGDFAHEVFCELNKYAAKELPAMILGTGSVVEAGTASLYIQSGSNFIVSPVLNEDVAKTCNRRKILWLPGCGSVSEISKAEELGAEIVKIFPGSQVGGPKFIEAVKGPMPWTHMMPTGGVEPNEDNLKAWFQAGAACVGLGSQLLQKSLVESGNFAEITRLCKVVLQLAKMYRKI